MRQNSNSIVISIGLLVSFSSAIPLCAADESDKPSFSQENTTSRVHSCSSTCLSAAAKIDAEKKERAEEKKEKSPSSTPAPANKPMLDLQERRRIGNLLFPSNCVPAKDLEDMQRMVKTGTMEERLLRAGYPKERYDKFVESIQRMNSMRKASEPN